MFRPIARLACDGSACARKHSGWACLSAEASASPQLGFCSKGKSRVAAFMPDD